MSKKIRLISGTQVEQLNSLNKLQIDFKRLELDTIDGGRFAQGTGVQLQQSIDALVQDFPDIPEASFPRQSSLLRWMPEAGRKCLRDAPSCTSNSQPKRSFAESNCAGPVEHQGLIASEGSKGVRKHVLFCSGKFVFCKACGLHTCRQGRRLWSLRHEPCHAGMGKMTSGQKGRWRNLLKGLHPETLEPLGQAVPWQ